MVGKMITIQIYSLRESLNVSDTDNRAQTLQINNVPPDGSKHKTVDIRESPLSVGSGLSC